MVSGMIDSQHAVHQSAQPIGEFAKAFANLAAENSELKQENKTLRHEIQQLESRGMNRQRPSRENNHDLELLDTILNHAKGRIIRWYVL